MLTNWTITTDGSNVLANLAILAIFMQITSPETGQRVGEFGDLGHFYYIMSGGRAERYISSSFIERVAQAKSFLYNACCPRGERKAILIYIFPLLFISFAL